MVVGNGLMGQTFSNYKYNSEILIFASGVSNSTANDSRQFEREKALLLAVISKYSDKKTIYFSTCSIYNNSTLKNAYVEHKLEMETIVKSYCPHYIIFRVSNIVGKTGNSNTLINYFVHAVNNAIKINIWKYAQRNIIDIEDVKYIVESKINSGTENIIVNIAVRKSEFVTDILCQVEKYLGKKSINNIIDIGGILEIDTREISNELDIIESKKGEGLTYIYSILEKYYQSN